MPAAFTKQGTNLYDSNGYLIVNVGAGGGSGGTSSSFGSAFPATGTAAGFEDVSGNMAAGNLDASGNLKVAGSFSSTPPTSSSSNAVAQTTVSSSSGQILAANLSRKACGVKNTGTVTIYLGFGRIPTVTAYHIALSSSGVHDDGFGGYWDGTVSGVLWQGAVNAICAGGGTVTVTEFT